MTRAVFTNYNDFLKRKELKEILRYNFDDISSNTISNTSINNYNNINNEFFDYSGNSLIKNINNITKIKNYSDYSFYNRHNMNLKILNNYKY